MKRTIILTALCALAGCGGGGDGTFVLVRMERGDAPAGVTRVDLEVTLSGKTATARVDNADHTPIAFPKTKSLGLNSGQGTIRIVAIGRDASDVEVARGETTAFVERDQTSNVTVTFGVTQVLTDGGLDGMVEADAEVCCRLSVVAQNRGLGLGTVTVSPQTGSSSTCDNTTCNRTFDPGAMVDLIAVPGAVGKFMGWTGDCSGTITCTLTMDAVKNVGAIFEAYQLSMNVTGTGTVALSNPSGMACPPNCAVTYAGSTEMVTLTPQAGGGQAFGGWTGACQPSGVTPCTLTMNANRAVTGSFGTARALTVTLAGGGQGTVTSADLGIDCGSTCTNAYVDGRMVVLTATPVTGHSFGGFAPAGVCSASTATTCTVTMDTAKTVTATFSVVGIDLIVSTVSCTPTAFTPGSSPTCSITVQNIGNMPAPATTVALYASLDAVRDAADMSLGAACTVPALAAAQSMVVSCVRAWPGAAAIFGPANLIALVDPTNTVTEASESNNVGLQAVTLRSSSQYELVPTTVTCTGSGTTGTGVSCMVTVFNAGTTAVTTAQSIASTFQLASTDTATTGASIGSCTAITSGIPSLGTAMTTCTGAIPAATPLRSVQYLLVRVNSSTTVSEDTPGNNLVRRPFYVTVVGGPDLVADGLACPAAAVPGSAVSCAVTVRNFGDQVAGPFAIELRLSTDTTIAAPDALIATCTSTALATAQAATVQCTGTLPAGLAASVQNLGVIIDSASAVTEVSETNNTASRPLTLGPDLVVTGVSCSAVARGADMPCMVTLQNIGSATAGASMLELRRSTDMTINGSDPLFMTCGVAAIAPAATQVVSCTAPLSAATPLGTYYMGAIADSTGVVAEANESNNTGVGGTVRVGPNLGGVSINTVTPSNWFRGQSANLNITLFNSGPESTSVGFTIQIRFNVDLVVDSNDPLLATCNVSAIPAFGSATLDCGGTIPTSLASTGTGVPIILDTGNAVSEADEGDNISNGLSVFIN